MIGVSALAVTLLVVLLILRYLARPKPPEPASTADEAPTTLTGPKASSPATGRRSDDGVTDEERIAEPTSLTGLPPQKRPSTGLLALPEQLLSSRLVRSSTRALLAPFTSTPKPDADATTATSNKAVSLAELM
jgi:hypothetical protein